MPIIKNILRQGVTKFQGLANFDVFVDEELTSAEGAVISKYFQITNFPAPIPLGNSFFSIRGSNLLKPNVEIKTEILDNNGNPVFHFPVKRGGFNLGNPAIIDISIEAMPGKTADGPGQLIVLGELDPTKIDVPIKFSDTYNIRIQTGINFDTTIPNTRPIKFYREPKINVAESVRNNIDFTSTDLTDTNLTITGSGTFFGGSEAGSQFSRTSTNPSDESNNNANEDTLT